MSKGTRQRMIINHLLTQPRIIRYSSENHPEDYRILVDFYSTFQRLLF